MSDAKAEVSKALSESRRRLDDLHHRLSAMADTDKEKVKSAVDRFKAAHNKFEDDAQEFVVH